MTSEDTEPPQPERPREGRKIAQQQDRYLFRGDSPFHSTADDASANERWELRQKAKAACERALDSANAAEPDDLERLRLGLHAAQLLLQLQPPPWHGQPCMPPPSHGFPYGHAGEGINFATHTAADVFARWSHDAPVTMGIVDTGSASEGEWHLGPPPPTREDLLAAGQKVSQNELNLTRDEPSGWLLDGDEDGVDQQ